MEKVLVRILLVDDHEVVRRGVRALLEAQPGFSVCGEACDGRTAVELARLTTPDLVIMDIGLPLLNGTEATRRIVQKIPGVRVIILSMHHSEQLVREALSAGAAGYVLKSDAAKDLLAAIEAVRSGVPFYSALVADLTGALPEEG
jgi:DNA-binding NarL/FixJ family response regulator